MTSEENAANPVENKASVGPGEILSSAREQQGLTQQQVADRLHLRLSSVQAIESDSIEQGVSITFTKGYVRLYARLLGINADPLLKSFDKIHVSSNPPSKLQSFSKRVEREANDSRWNFVTYIIILLLVGLLVVWWVDQSNFSFSDSFNAQQPSDSEQTEQTQSTVNLREDSSSQVYQPDTSFDSTATADEENISAAQSALDSLATSGAETEDTGVFVAQDEAQTSVDPLSTVDQESQELNEAQPADDFTATVTQAGDLEQNAQDVIEAVSSSEVEEAEVEGVNESTVVNTEDLPYTLNPDGSVDMTFTFADDCWVSVKDAFDETIAVGVKVKGRVMEVSGVPPIKIILGAPQVVDIDFGGQAIDMSRFDDGRTANFELPSQGE
jgi:cytoskeleton protein RodZ